MAAVTIALARSFSLGPCSCHCPYYTACVAQGSFALTLLSGGPYQRLIWWRKTIGPDFRSGVRDHAAPAFHPFGAKMPGLARGHSEKISAMFVLRTPLVRKTTAVPHAAAGVRERRIPDWSALPASFAFSAWDLARQRNRPCRKRNTPGTPLYRLPHGCPRGHSREPLPPTASAA